MAQRSRLLQLGRLLASQQATRAASQQGRCCSTSTTTSTSTSSAWQQLQRHLRRGLASQPGARAGAAGSARGGAAAQPGGASSPSGFGRWWAAFASAPTVPKVLGLSGAIPFIALAPPVSKHLTGVLPADVVDNAAMIQVCYGAVIVSFLGAVHWGAALSTAGLAGPVAARLANESFVYSVLPSLAAWPVALLEPGAGAVVLSLLLPACYVADRTRRNVLPAWYLALRVPLTLLATFGCLLTATRHIHAELDRAQQLRAAEQPRGGGAK